MLDTEYIETVLKGKDGLEFQKYCVNFLKKNIMVHFRKLLQWARSGMAVKMGMSLKQENILPCRPGPKI
jgi:hypothetical protein